MKKGKQILPVRQGRLLSHRFAVAVAVRVEFRAGWHAAARAGGEEKDKGRAICEHVETYGRLFQILF